VVETFHQPRLIPKYLTESNVPSWESSANQPDVVVNFFDADGVAGKDRAEINLFATQTDAAATGDDNDSVVQGIIDIGQSFISATRGLIDLGRAPHAESFVWTFLVEDLDKVIEPGLLLKKVQTGRLGGFFFQREMHAFMAAVLLRMARLDALNANAQPEPPDREFAQIEQGVRGSERHTVIAADVGGQAALLKQPFKHSESVVFSC
jgi:hypothetical protein